MNFTIHNKKIYLIIVALSLVVFGCYSYKFFYTKNEPKQKLYQLSFHSLGTLIDIKIYKNNITAQNLTNIHQDIKKILNYYHNNWYPIRDGELKNINDAIANNKNIKISHEMQKVISTGQQLEKISKGYFNPTLANISALWGFYQHNHKKIDNNISTKISNIIATKPSTNSLHINNNILSGDNKYVQLDLGGFAKGFISQKIISLLKNKYYIENMLINLGGDIATYGISPTNKWQIALYLPNKSHLNKQIILSLTNNQAVATSGGYFRHIKYNNKIYNHIFNPQQGISADYLLSVTVIAKDLILADAAATALFAAGKNWRSVAQNMNLKQVLIVDNNYQLITKIKK